VVFRLFGGKTKNRHIVILLTEVTSSPVLHISSRHRPSPFASRTGHNLRRGLIRLTDARNSTIYSVWRGVFLLFKI
jgi:hypothetical protein